MHSRILMASVSHRGTGVYIKRHTDEDRFWRFVTKGKKDECWNWTGARTGKNGMYGAFVSGCAWSAHRFSYIAHKGTVPKGLDVMHTCDNGLCVNPNHLEVGTRKENMRQAMERGRLRPYDRRGEKNSNAYLTKEDVEKIRKYTNDGYTQKSIAEEFGVTRHMIYLITSNKAWRS